MYVKGYLAHSGSIVHNKSGNLVVAHLLEIKEMRLSTSAHVQKWASGWKEWMELGWRRKDSEKEEDKNEKDSLIPLLFPYIP